MKILGIETSCDETALSIIEGSGSIESPSFSVLGTSLFSQIKIHQQYGGVFPNVAKREHAKNLIPLIKKLFDEIVFIPDSNKTIITEIQKEYLQKTLEREPELYTTFVEYIQTIPKPNIDAIAVTYGPGLEPALWVGINFAKALNYIWDIPVIPVNHMEGHILSVLTSTKKPIIFPALALLISGGHTELVHIESWGKYKIVGETKDDAVGEAFDKVARMLGLPYPGGPQISKLAEIKRSSDDNTTKDSKKTANYSLPRPMLHSQDLNFSFSGLKTAVLYMIKKIPEITDDIRQNIACEFENAVTEVLFTKTKKAIEQYGIKSLIVGGGVIANKHLQNTFLSLEKEVPGLQVSIPEMSLTTDNAVMIAIAGYVQAILNKNILHKNTEEIVAQGNVRL